MKKILDKFKKYFNVNKKMFLFLTILLVIGIAAGSIFALTIIDADSEIVSAYLKSYLSSISENEISYFDSFISTFLSNTIIFLIIWILGFSIIGIPIILILFFYKTFIFGFVISSILINYKAKGILLSIVYMLPHHAIDLIILMILIIYSYTMSSKILKAVLKKEEISFKNMTNSYLIILGITLIFNLILSLYGSIAVPKIIEFILPFLIK